MKISELITRLEETKAEYGDLHCIINDTEYGDYLIDGVEVEGAVDLINVSPSDRKILEDAQKIVRLTR